IEQNPPPMASRGRYIKIKYITQIKNPTPQFAFFCNLPQDVKESYRRFLENKMRELFDFQGVPLTIYFREK
ncbi:MAG TPA: ribosome biogenesis GTPase Der, partial [Bacteroidales bacterium]